MASTQTLPISWHYQPVVMALAGGLAAYAIYTMYSASNRLPNSTLHRSNAVHRPRRRQPEISNSNDGRGPIMTFHQPTHADPLGLLTITEDSGDFEPRTMTLRLGHSGMPALSDLEALRPDPQAAYCSILEFALLSMLSACVQLRDRPVFHLSQHHLDAAGFHQLWDMVRTRNEAELAHHASSLPLMLNLVTASSPLTDEVSHRVVRDFIVSDLWQVPPGSESLEPLDSANAEEIHAETEEYAEHPGARDPNHGIRGLLYYIAEENSARRAYVHRGIRCEGCNEFPILGVRYHCLNCPDYDLCATCEAHAVHPKTHVFVKIKVPLSLLSQPPKPHKLWYAGDPRKVHPTLDVTTRKRLSTEFGFQEEELDALYDQFTCIANVPWLHDSSKVEAAIDRHAFNKTMSSDRWDNRFAPNVILDRMFAFYDTDNNSLIGFNEFISGMSYLRGSNRFASLRRALQGFDMDGDSYVSRADFLRVFRAKFEIHKQLIIDATESREVERSLNAADVLRSSQPISAIFNDEQIPADGARISRGKREDEHGDMVPIDDETTILPDEDPFYDQRRGHERLAEALDRFEDSLAGGEQNGAPMLDGSIDHTDEAFLFLQAEMPSVAESEPYVQDLLWHYKQAGLNALLEPLFAERESLEQRAVASRDARRRWRTAIDRLRERENITSETIISESDSAARTHEEPASVPLPHGIVPTDNRSLEQRELEFMRASLDSLLEASGYSIREDPPGDANEVPVSEPSAADVGMGSDHMSALPLASSPLHDTQLALNQENEMSHRIGAEAGANHPSVLSDHDGEHEGDSSEDPPSQETLRFWARLEVVDRDTMERGGPGRLSLDEVESLVVDRNLIEVRGIIKSWLDWCAF